MEKRGEVLISDNDGEPNLQVGNRYREIKLTIIFF